MGMCEYCGGSDSGLAGMFTHPPMSGSVYRGHRPKCPVGQMGHRIGPDILRETGVGTADKPYWWTTLYVPGDVGDGETKERARKALTKLSQSGLDVEFTHTKQKNDTFSVVFRFPRVGSEGPDEAIGRFNKVMKTALEPKAIGTAPPPGMGPHSVRITQRQLEEQVGFQAGPKDKTPPGFVFRFPLPKMGKKPTPAPTPAPAPAVPAPAGGGGFADDNDQGGGFAP